jgi:outer membrane immunogenic protein
MLARGDFTLSQDKECSADIFSIGQTGGELMRNILAATIVLSFLASMEAVNAADLPMKAPTPVPSAPASVAHSWTGFYVGGNGGYAWHDPTVSFAGNDITTQTFSCGGFAGSTCAPPISFNISGSLGGVQAGYNWQIDQSWLLGVEADFDWSNIRGAGTGAGFSFGGAASNFQASQDVNDFGTVRARLGYLPTDSLLLYGTGGFAYGHVFENASLNSSNSGGGVGGGPGFFCFAPGQNCFIGSTSRVAPGWTVGAGVEYALWNNLSLKAEYEFVSLAGDTVKVVNVTPAAGVGIASFSANYGHVDFNIVRGGINYRF